MLTAEVLWHLAVRLPPSRKAAVSPVSCSRDQTLHCPHRGPHISLQWLPAALELTRVSCPLVPLQGPAGVGSRGAVLVAEEQSPEAAPCCGPGCAQGAHASLKFLSKSCCACQGLSGAHCPRCVVSLPCRIGVFATGGVLVLWGALCPWWEL